MQPKLDLRAFALVSAAEVERRVSASVEIVEPMGATISATILSTLDDKGTSNLVVVPDQALQPNQWHQLFVRARPPEVVLQGGATEWRVDFYTGHIVQIASIMRPDAPKEGVLYVRMTEIVDFDKQWAARMFFDESGGVIPGCVEMNGGCSNSGRASVRDVAVVLEDPAASARVSHVADFDATGEPSLDSRRRLAFKPCQAGAQCDDGREASSK
jgi:hypothetical protein